MSSVSIASVGFPKVLFPAKQTDITWHNGGKVAFADKQEWSYYVTIQTLPSAFVLRMRINKISFVGGDWTIFLGLTPSPEIKKSFGPSNHAVAISTTHCAFTKINEAFDIMIKEGDIITLILDAKKNYYFQANHEEITIDFQDIAGNVYLACSLYGNRQEVEIIELIDLSE